MGRYDNVVIRASAGTGKTFQLSNRYLGLLNSGAPLDEILATTFTRKAAGEILDRVILRLATAARDDGGCAELAEQLQDRSLTRDRCLKMLEHVAQNLHRLRIGTLDSFFSQIAGTFGLELGLPPGWRILDDLPDAQLRKQAIESILRGDASAEVSRLIHLITKGDADRSISELLRSTVNDLYEVFCETTAAAWEKFPHPRLLSREELAATLDELRVTPLPADKRYEEARQSDCQKIVEQDWESLIKQGPAAKVLAGETRYYNKDIPPAALQLYERLLQHAKGLLIDQLAKQTGATYELLAKFDAAYRELKFKARALRFEDITRRMEDLPRLGDVDRLSFRLDTRVSHLLLDEFQDTSLPQWQALRPFAERVTHTGKQQAFFFTGGQSSFFCVGDGKQAIYGWRGGRSEIFAALEANLNRLGHITLSQSFRSAQPVIDTVNEVFARLLNHATLEKLEPAVQAFCAQFPKHSTAKTKLRGYTCLVAAPRAEDSTAQQDVTLRFAAERIAQIVRDAPGRSVGVLTRRNKIVAHLIFELRRLGVPASEEGGNPLTDSAAVQAVLSLLKLADHPGDTVARFHLANSPLAEWLKFTDYSDDLAAAQLAQHVRRSLLDDGYGPTLFVWVRQLAASCNRRDLNRLQQLVELAYGYQSDATLRTADFIDYVESKRVADPATADVRVMTVHQAKGLQFDVVVLADLDAKLVGQPKACVVGQPDPTQPIDRVCLNRGEHIQKLLPADLQQLFLDGLHEVATESLCVLYVSLTRPIHALHMVISPSSPKERSLPKSSAGLLRAALTDGVPASPNTTLYEHGDARWFETDRTKPAKLPTTNVTATRAAETASPLQVRLAAMTGGRRRGLERVAPSSLEGGARFKLTDVLRLDSSAALDRGTLFHKWFELIEWLDDGRPNEVALRQAANEVLRTPLLDAELSKQMQEFLAVLDSPELARTLSRATYQPPREIGLPPRVLAELSDASLRVEVHNEQPFATHDAGRLLVGTIDRLVYLFQDEKLVAAEILDFKTDAIAKDDAAALAAKVDHYRPQIESYRRAIGKLTRLPPERIVARLLFVCAGQVGRL